MLSMWPWFQESMPALRRMATIRDQNEHVYNELLASFHQNLPYYGKAWIVNKLDQLLHLVCCD